jgi:hypothetical protein
VLALVLVIAAVAAVTAACLAGGWLAPWVVRLAAGILPGRLRAVREAEWLAELDAFDGPRPAKLAWSAGVCAAALRLVLRYRSESAADWRDRLFPRFSPAPGTVYASRRHPAALLAPGAASLLLLAAAAALSAGIPAVPHPGQVMTAAAGWLGWLVSCCWLARRTRAWTVDVWYATADRLAVPGPARGPGGTNIPRGLIADVRVRQSLPARLLGYGTLVIEGHDGVLLTLSCAPFPQAVARAFAAWRDSGTWPAALFASSDRNRP